MRLPVSLATDRDIRGIRPTRPVRPAGPARAIFSEMGALFACAIALAACGGGDDDGNPFGGGKSESGDNGSSDNSSGGDSNSSGEPGFPGVKVAEGIGVQVRAEWTAPATGSPANAAFGASMQAFYLKDTSPVLGEASFGTEVKQIPYNPGLNNAMPGMYLVQSPDIGYTGKFRFELKGDHPASGELTAMPFFGDLVVPAEITKGVDLPITWGAVPADATCRVDITGRTTYRSEEMTGATSLTIPGKSLEDPGPGQLHVSCVQKAAGSTIRFGAVWILRRTANIQVK